MPRVEATPAKPAAKNTNKFGKGNPGKPKGAVNKVTKELRVMVLEALDKAGGVTYLASKAETHPAAFLSLVGKVLPMQVTGAGGEPLKLTVEYVRPNRDPSATS